MKYSTTVSKSEGCIELHLNKYFIILLLFAFWFIPMNTCITSIPLAQVSHDSLNIHRLVSNWIRLIIQTLLTWQLIINSYWFDYINIYIYIHTFSLFIANLDNQAVQNLLGKIYISMPVCYLQHCFVQRQTRQ